jgi:hypothetical protein
MTAAEETFRQQRQERIIQRSTCLQFVDDGCNSDNADDNPVNAL